MSPTSVFKTSSSTHCTAPTGRRGKHCGKKLRPRYCTQTCGSPQCTTWLLITGGHKKKGQAAKAA